MTNSSTVSLNLPFDRGNTWDCAENIEEPQRCFSNRGEVDGNVSYYGINYNAQLRGNAVELPAPIDTPRALMGSHSLQPGEANCALGPIRLQENKNYCSTNVVSRPVPSCHEIPSDTAPRCEPGLTPTIIGCDSGTYRRGGPRAQWQCLPSPISQNE